MRGKLKNVRIKSVVLISPQESECLSISERYPTMCIRDRHPAVYTVKISEKSDPRDDNESFLARVTYAIEVYETREMDAFVF
jgi:hypothetical protein